MNDNLFDNLKLYEVDVEGALYRLFDDKELYRELLLSFKEDSTIYELNEAIRTESWDDAFTAVHALKGLAGNLGFVSLLYRTAELVLLIRKGKIDEIKESFKKILDSYNEIIRVIEMSEKKG